MASLEFEVAQLPLKERRPRPGVVLVFRQHVPDQNGEFAGSGNSGDLLASLESDALEERA